jgi:hypothetical protein
MNRRRFLSLAAATAATAPSLTRALAQSATQVAHHTTPRKVADVDIFDGPALVAATDHDRILKAANAFLLEKPDTITNYHSPLSPGGPHDYFSQSDYWWPDPANPTGSYIRRDGETNPDNFVAHRDVLRRMSIHVPTLTCAWLLTHDIKYANKAADHLRAWFATPETRMNPNLTYAQIIIRYKSMRGIGIIDTLHLIEVARSVMFLRGTAALPAADSAAVTGWFADYVTWLTTSKQGTMEREEVNNHGASWLLQTSTYATLTGDTKTVDFCRDRFKNVIVNNQIAKDGSLPLELARTKPYSYSIFCLDELADITQLLSTPTDNLWLYKGKNGVGIQEAVAFLYPFLKDKSKWPYKQDVEFWEAFPNRQPCLLFAGLAYKNADYINLWKSLNPDPTVFEAIRNFPVRQPLLWVMKPKA